MSGGPVLVTGASGFIGRAVVRQLRAEGREVRCLVRATSSRDGLDGPGVELAVGSLGDEASLSRAVAGCDGTIHLASVLKVPWKPEFRTLNVEGTRALARACARAGTPLVLTSSLAAAGPSPHDAPRDEAVPATPVSRYGRVKLACEQAAAALAADLPLTILRPPMVLGEQDAWTLPLFQAAARGWMPLPAPDARVAAVHVDDLAQALAGALDRGERLGPSADGAYYVACAHQPTWAELGALLAAAQGRPPPRVLPVPPLALRAIALASEAVGRLRDRPVALNTDKATEALAGSWTCRTAKAARDLGFAPPPLADCLARTVAGYRRRSRLK